MNETIMMIQAVINSLNTIEVKGMHNLDTLLACMQTLENVKGLLMKEGEDNG